MLCLFLILSPSRQGLLVLIKIVHYAHYPVFHQDGTKVKQVPKLKSGEAQVSEYLLLVRVSQIFN